MPAAETPLTETTESFVSARFVWTLSVSPLVILHTLDRYHTLIHSAYHGLDDVEKKLLALVYLLLECIPTACYIKCVVAFVAEISYRQIVGFMTCTLAKLRGA
jgi:hypothetical protein